MTRGDRAAPNPVNGWDGPSCAAAPVGDAPVLAVDGFEGPLPWLLELARTQRVEAFGAALAAALRPQPQRPDLARWAGWLVMAADLAWLRSRLLLPPEAPGASAVQAEAEALRRRLLEADAMRRAALWLEARPQLGRAVFRRGAGMAGGAGPAHRAASVTDLLQACLLVLRVPGQGASHAPALPPLWRVQDALARIAQALREKPGGSGLGDFLPRVGRDGPDRDLRCRAALASTLVASLELSRTGDVTLRQGEPWQAIQVEARQPATGGPAL